MASPRTAEREEERRLNTRTLTIASVASASAAAVTSQLWIAGTWIAAALTPVLVALISEAMHRPTERIARAWTTEREPRRARRQTTTRREPITVTGAAGPMRVYRQSGSRTMPAAAPLILSRRRIAIGAVAATAALAFVIGIAALTTVDLVSGGSVGKGSGRSTLFSGGGSGKQEKQSDGNTVPQGQDTPAKPDTTTDPPPTTTSPEPEEPRSDTAPVPAPTDTPPGEPLPETPTP
jgi:hypothetical protein